MASPKDSEDYPQDESAEIEKQGLLDPFFIPKTRRSWIFSIPHIFALYASNAALLLLVIILSIELRKGPGDPSLGIWCKSLIF